MSALAPRTAAVPRESREVFVADARTARVRWRVSRAALDRLGGGAAGRGGEEPELDVVVTLGAGARGEVRAVLRWRDGQRDGELPPGPVTVAVIHDGGLVHWRAAAGEGGGAVVLLDATLDAGGVRYARTGLFGALGLGGGRYEVVRGDAEGA